MCKHCLNRREFLGTTAILAASAAGVGAFAARAGASSEWAADMWDPQRALSRAGKPLRVQPVLMYEVMQPREMASWKSWSDIRTDQAAADEAGRIAKELKIGRASCRERV